MKSDSLILSLFCFILISLSIQQVVHLKLNNSEIYGSYIVHPNGTALYMFEPDSYNKSTCYNSCIKFWPIYQYNSSENLTVDSGLNQSLIGHSERTDNTSIITYKGWPLYFYAGETNTNSSGTTLGQGVLGSGGYWWILSPSGNPNQIKKGFTESKPSNNTVEAISSTEYGKYISDFNGTSLYVFSLDVNFSVSTCYDNCATEWPPYLVDDPTKITNGTSTLRSLLNSKNRTDGKNQINYNGHPLYYYKNDNGSNATSGQGIEESGGVWNLISVEGEIIGEKEKEESFGEILKVRFFILVFIIYSLMV